MNKPNQNLAISRSIIYTSVWTAHMRWARTRYGGLLVSEMGIMHGNSVRLASILQSYLHFCMLGEDYHASSHVPPVSPSREDLKAGIVHPGGQRLTATAAAIQVDMMYALNPLGPWL